MSNRIAVLASGSIYDRKGYFNAVINRTKHLALNSTYEIDFFLMSEYEPWIVRRLRHTKKRETPYSVNIDGVQVNLLWHRFSIIDYFIKVRLHKKSIFKTRFLKKVVEKLKGYDFIIAHSIDSGMVASMVKEKYGIPFSCTWHGTDTHTIPFQNPFVFKDTKHVIENANVNFYVSKTLKETSDRITNSGNKEVLYNGCDERFFDYSKEKKDALRKQFGVTDRDVVVFIGSFMDVKNVLLIPDIFRYVYEQNKNATLWMVGDGKLRGEVERKSVDLPIMFWGYREPECMPDILNAADVLILPSKNEGLPLSTVEGIRCGCHVVGSLVGGIPEVIGKENCIPVDSLNFAKDFADKIIYYLGPGKHQPQLIEDHFSWSESAKKEIKSIECIIK